MMNPHENLESSTPGAAWMVSLEKLLREPSESLRELLGEGGREARAALAALLLFGILAYGLVMGSFSGGAQWWQVPVKLSAGLILSGLICLPSLYLTGCLCGARCGLRESAFILLGMLTLQVVLLLGLAPVAWVFSQSTTAASFMGVLHLAFWGLSMVFAFRLLWLAFRQAGAKLQMGAIAWIILFTLVTLQMTTTLRPLLGPGEAYLETGKKFFLVHWGENLLRDIKGPSEGVYPKENETRQAGEGAPVVRR